MVKVKANAFLAIDGEVKLEQWFEQLIDKGYGESLEAIRQICTLVQQAEKSNILSIDIPCIQFALGMADVLADLKVDQETILAAIAFEGINHSAVSLEEIEEMLGEKQGPIVAKLVNGIGKMSAIHHFQTVRKGSKRKEQINNLRKMLLAMVDDGRVVLIKLAERLCLLRVSNRFAPDLRQEIANEAMEIYAPLANRLGVGAIKWEMEDLAFRALHPDDYKEIAKGLNAKRLDRDHYVNLIVEELKNKINEMGIKHSTIYGRSKHIHSIYRKMKRKNVSLDEIYDATAIRILVDTQEECYELLSLVHTLWEQVPKEFDDYISNPKTNGYQSLHTAVKGPQDRIFEVQIRTFRMHELAEMGIAAHWRYKEGSVLTSKNSHERKIEWLRDVLAWHQEMANAQEDSKKLTKEFLEDRVYLFSPNGDVFDLPQGVTPLDFAYHLHTQIGHRCRGAKVNYNIVPLTSVLKTGDRVEILTGKEERPSRDWVNPHRHFLTTQRARSKILHWFKMQDYDKDKQIGQELAEKALKTLGLKAESLNQVIADFHFKRLDDLFAALGRNDLKIGQILGKRSLHKLLPPEFSTNVEHGNESNSLEKEPTSIKNLAKIEANSNLRIEGIDNVLTHKARCCEPEPGDEVIGYITVGRGISIHKRNCPNILRSSKKQQERLLQVHWHNNH